MRARAARLVASLGAVALLVLAIPGSPVTAQPRELDDQIQILGITDDGAGEIALELAIPAAIGELAPVETNFGVTDGGRLVDFTVAPLSTAVDAVVVLDTSGSMQGPALAAAKEAAAGFIDQLPAEARVGLISFGETATVHRELGTDRSGPLQDIGELSAAGETALWDSLVAAADLVDRGDGDRPFVVVLSDGEDTSSAATRAAAVDRLRAVSAGLYAVAIESPDTDLDTLQRVVGEVGGQFIATTDIGELDALYRDIAGRLTSRYELRFPSDRSDARRIVVSVAVDGTVATASTTVGRGAAAGAGDGPAKVLNVPDDSALGAIPSPTPGLLGSASARWVGVGLLFAAFVVIALMMLLPATQVRLDTAVGADRVAGFNNRVALATDRFIARRDGEGELDKALDAAGIDLRPGEFVLVSLAGIIGASLAASFLGGMVLGVATTLLATLGTFAYLTTRAGRRRSRFADQLTDTLGIMTGGLRAGRGLPQVIELVAEEAPSPTAEQFQRIVFETRVGRDLTESMLGVATRMKSQDLDWITRAVDINRELGGDLTEMLDNVADTIRDRRRVARQVRALSAEGRASGWVLLALPVLMFLFLWWRTPENVALMVGEPVGLVMLAMASLGMIVGFFWIRKLVDLKY